MSATYAERLHACRIDVTQGLMLLKVVGGKASVSNIKAKAGAR